MEDTSEKRPYEPPQLTTHGSFEEITQGTTLGNRTDAFFPAGTPRGAITFS